MQRKQTAWQMEAHSPCVEEPIWTFLLQFPQLGLYKMSICPEKDGGITSFSVIVYPFPIPLISTFTLYLRAKENSKHQHPCSNFYPFNSLRACGTVPIMPLFFPFSSSSPVLSSYPHVILHALLHGLLLCLSLPLSGISSLSNLLIFFTENVEE